MVSVPKGDPQTREAISGPSSIDTTEGFSEIAHATTTSTPPHGREGIDPIMPSPSRAWGIRAWGAVTNKIGLSNNSTDHSQGTSTHQHHEHTNLDDGSVPGVMVDRIEAGGTRDIEMHLEPQALEAQLPLPDSSHTRTTQLPPQPPPQKSERSTALQKERYALERHMDAESKFIPPQRKPEPQGPGAEWQAERRLLLRQIETIQYEQRKQQDFIDRLSGENSYLKSQVEGLQHDYFELKHAKDALSRQYEEWQDQLKEKVQTKENEKLELQGQLAKMSEIISQLNKKGLPLPPDDNYLSQAFDSLIADTRQWARLFAKGQPPLTIEALNEVPFSADMITHLQDSFLDLKSLLNSTSVGSKVRTRCLEALLLRTFTGSCLSGRYIGFNHELYDKVQATLDSFGGSSEQEDQFWSALTNHLMTKDNDEFVERQNREIDQITNHLYDQLLPLGGPSKGATKQSLKDLVTKVAKLGLLIAQLPFRIVGKDIKLGTKRYSPIIMENIDGDIEGGSIGSPVTINLCRFWMKETFDDNGDPVEVKKAAETHIYSKARVSCLT